MRFIYLAILILLLFTGCQSIPQDPTPAPIKNNLLTLEMSSCGQTQVGLIGCFYKDDLKPTLTIPLWEKGEYQIKSDRCNFFENKRYMSQQDLVISYETLLANKPQFENTCLYNIKVFIQGFDFGFEGFFLLTDIDTFKPAAFSFGKESFDGHAGLQTREGAEVLDSFKFERPYSGTLVWEGCNVSGEVAFNKNAKLDFKTIFPGYITTKDSCILTLGVIPDDENLPRELAEIHFNIFDKSVVPLNDPTITYKNEKLKVVADKLVAGIVIDKDVSIEHGNKEKSFSSSVKKDQEVFVRLLTSNGRYLLLKVKNGEVLWKTLYRF